MPATETILLNYIVTIDCSAKALSKYTEMVDSLIRQQMDALAAASDEARLKLREWELPECLQVCYSQVSFLLLTNYLLILVTTTA